MTDPPEVLTISFEPPGKLINLNDREHWSKRGALTKAWRTAGFYAIRQAMFDAGVQKLEGRQRVVVELPQKFNRRTDPSNMMPTIKALVDSGTDAGLWSDDDSEHVTVDEPTLKVGGTHVVMVIRPA